MHPEDLDEDDYSLVRDAQRRRGGGTAVFLVSLVTCTLLLCVGIIYIRKVQQDRVPDPVDEEAVLADATRLQSEGMDAFRAWARAVRDGDSLAEAKMHRIAQDKLQAALETLDRLLERYRDPRSGYLRPEYEGYEEQMGVIAQHLGDLQKGAKIR